MHSRCFLCMAILALAHGSQLSQASPPSLQPAVTTGRAAPQTGGGAFLGFGQVSANDAGIVVFNASVTGGDRGGGVFVLSPGGSIETIALGGGSLPEMEGAGFCGFRNPSINNANQVVFWARFCADGAQGREGSGLFFYSASEGLRPIVLDGQTVEHSSGRLGLTHVIDHSLNDRGEVAFTASFYSRQLGSRDGVFVYSEGEVTALVLPTSRLEPSPGEVIYSPSEALLGPDGAAKPIDLSHWS